MAKAQKITVDRSKIRMAIETGVPLSITTYTIPHGVEVYMTEVLTVFLTELNQKQMIEYLSYCVSELITNAKKANTKRVYFKTKNLNINEPSEYAKGMATFKDDTMQNIHHYRGRFFQKEENEDCSLNHRQHKLCFHLLN